MLSWPASQIDVRLWQRSELQARLRNVRARPKSKLLAIGYPLSESFSKVPLERSMIIYPAKVSDSLLPKGRRRMPHLPKFMYHCWERKRRRRIVKIVLNVSAFGLIQPVFLIPHSGRVTAKDVNLTSATSELLIELMIDFLDQVLANADKKGVGK